MSCSANSSAEGSTTGSMSASTNGLMSDSTMGSVGRLERLASALREEGAFAMYVRETPNIEWVTGFDNVFDGEQAHALFVTSDLSECAVRTDSRYSTAMEREAQESPFTVETQIASMSQWASFKCSQVLQNLQSAKVEPQVTPFDLAIEDTLALREYRALEREFSLCDSIDDQVRFIETSDLILRLRAIKDDSELRRMSTAQAITDAALDHILGFIAPGKTEREIQLELDDFMLKNGAEGLAFPSIVASGANGASPHAIVSDKPVELGECIVMDFGARAYGYCSDMTRTIFVGEPNAEMRRAWDALRRANETAEEKLCVKMTGKEAHEIAIGVLDAAGYEGRMGHSLGHGVGLQIHELPTLSPRNEEPLVCGNVVTVEPGIYIPGVFGMRLEDCGVLTNAGYERFTQSTHEMIVVK